MLVVVGDVDHRDIYNGSGRLDGNGRQCGSGRLAAFFATAFFSRCIHHEEMNFFSIVNSTHALHVINLV